MLREDFDDAVIKPVLENTPENMIDDKKAEIIDSLFKDYITFVLSGQALFGDENDKSDFKSKRDYYLNKFPDIYKDMIADPENKEIADAIGSIIVFKYGTLVLNNTGQLGKDQKEDITRRITSLIYMGEKGNNLAKDLILYSYYADGLRFGPTSFSSMFSTQLLTLIDGYKESLQELKAPTDEMANRFILQFFNNHPEMGVPKKIPPVSNEGSFTIDRNADQSYHNPVKSGVEPYRFIREKDGDRLFILESYDSDFIVYRQLPRFGGANVRHKKAIVYNSNKTIAQLSEEYKFVHNATQWSSPFDALDGFEGFGGLADYDPFGGLQMMIENNNQSETEPDEDNSGVAEFQEEPKETTTNEVQSSSETESTPAEKYTQEGSMQVETMC